MSLPHLYARALGMLAAKRRTIALLAAGNLAVAALQFLDPFLFGRVIGLLSRSDGMAPAEFWHTGLAVVGTWMAVGATGILVNMATVHLAERLAHRSRLAALRHCFEHVLSLPAAFHTSAKSGEVIKTAITGSDSLFALWLTFFRENLATAVAVFVLLPLSFVLNWRLAIVLAVLVVVFATVTLFVVRRTQAGQAAAEKHHFALTARAQDALANVAALQSFTRLQDEARALGALVESVLRRQMPVLTWWTVVNVLTRAAATIATIAIVVTGALLHIRGLATVSEIVAFMGFAGILIGRLEQGVSFASSLFMRAPVLRAFFGLLDTASSVRERDDAAELAVTHGEVAFENVAFAYPGGPAILADISFVARPGEVVALVGATGAGKTTAMSLLQRAWEPTEGGILIDGQDLRDVTLDSLRSRIGVVFQESLLLNRSIRDNLRIGKPDTTDAEIEAACRRAEAHEFIIRQKHGYDTVVGERGATLSGGQRQRLSIARALLKDAPILVLDEATSALDAATEARVARAMKELMRGRTTFVIAHRLSTVRDADQILVFDRGRIVERGTFDGLVRAGGQFAELVASQLQTVEAQ